MPIDSSAERRSTSAAPKGSGHYVAAGCKDQVASRSTPHTCTRVEEVYQRVHEANDDVQQLDVCPPSCHHTFAGSASLTTTEVTVTPPFRSLSTTLIPVSLSATLLSTIF